MRGSQSILLFSTTNCLNVVDLYDNGVLADDTAKDGVYSRFFPVPTAGTYTLSCQVWDDGTSSLIDGYTTTTNVIIDPESKNRDFQSSSSNF